MDFDWSSCGCAALWNTQTAIRIQCLFSLQSKSIYPPLRNISTKNRRSFLLPDWFMKLHESGIRGWIPDFNRDQRGLFGLTLFITRSIVQPSYDPTYLNYTFPVKISKAIFHE
jgi:hypothetical protein